MRNVGLILALAAVTLVLPAVVHAQVRIEGRVVDNRTHAPIGEADVRVYGAREQPLDRVRTDEDGRFSFELREHGGYTFLASGFGYQANRRTVLRTDGYDVHRIEIRLDSDTMLLAPIEVVARSRRPERRVPRGFEHRSEHGSGHYFTREDIDRLRPGRVTDLLARVPGVRLQASGSGYQRVVTMGRVGGGSCRAEIFIDGSRWTRTEFLSSPTDPGFTVDDAVAPADVVGVEVYSGLSTVPAEFLTARSRCGVVAIWTRRN